jgi:hypothetical protein
MRVVASKMTKVATASSAQAGGESPLMGRRPGEVARRLWAHGETVRGPVTIERIGFGQSPVPVGRQVRAKAYIAKVDTLDTAVQAPVTTVDVEGSDKPAEVIESIVRYAC